MRSRKHLPHCVRGRGRNRLPMRGKFLRTQFSILFPFSQSTFLRSRLRTGSNSIRLRMRSGWHTFKRLLLQRALFPINRVLPHNWTFNCGNNLLLRRRGKNS